MDDNLRRRLAKLLAVIAAPTTSPEERSNALALYEGMVAQAPSNLTLSDLTGPTGNRLDLAEEMQIAAAAVRGARMAMAEGVTVARLRDELAVAHARIEALEQPAEPVPSSPERSRPLPTQPVAQAPAPARTSPQAGRPWIPWGPEEDAWLLREYEILVLGSLGQPVAARCAVFADFVGRYNTKFGRRRSPAAIRVHLRKRGVAIKLFPEYVSHGQRPVEPDLLELARPV